MVAAYHAATALRNTRFLILDATDLTLLSSIELRGIKLKLLIVGLYVESCTSVYVRLACPNWLYRGNQVHISCPSLSNLC